MHIEESKVGEEKTDAAQFDRETEQSKVQGEKTDAAFYWTVVVRGRGGGGGGGLKEVPVCEGGEKRALKRKDIEPFVEQALRFLLNHHKSKEFEAFESRFL